MNMIDTRGEVEGTPAGITKTGVCIIGAGSSGVAAAKALMESGVEFDIFEKGSAVGGMWRYQNDNGLSSAYASLHIDTSRLNAGYPDFPLPENFPDFPSHKQFLNHLEAYSDKFGVTPKVRFRTSVTSVRRAADGLWEVTLDSGGTRRYKSVVVANGHLWDPQMPSFWGSFAGDQIHSHHYRTAAPFAGRDVLVVGIGNSAVDIAVDLCRTARSVTMSTRRSAWIMPKYLMGIPIDRWSSFLSRKLGLPTKLTRAIMSKLIVIGVGDQRRFGVKRPEHPMWREHATLSQELLPYVGHGWIKMKPNIAELQGGEVTFVDASRGEFDAIIYATGYKTTFPFLDRKLFAIEEEHPVPLYRRLAATAAPGLFFIGLVQPVGPTIPLVEVQARWLAAVLSDRITLPDRAAMEADINEAYRRQSKTYVKSARYTLEVDFRDYARQLTKDMRG